jgi:hypothetical protein
MGVLVPSWNTLKIRDFPMLIRTVNSHFDRVGIGDWERISGPRLSAIATVRWHPRSILPTVAVCLHMLVT